MKDNKGLTVASPDFRTKYKNLVDLVYPNIAPTSMYIAAPLGQQSLFNSAESQNVFQASYDADLHSGVWQFRAQSCFINDESLDCDPGANFVTIEFINLCDTPNAANYADCLVDSNSEQEDATQGDTIDDGMDGQNEQNSDQTDAEIDVSNREDFGGDTVAIVNSPPKFVDFDAQVVHEVTQE